MDATGADDRDLAETIHAFEAAISARPQPLIEPRVRRVLLALDGSNQDDTSGVLAMALARRLEAPLSVLDAGPAPEAPERREALRAQLRAIEEVGLEAEILDDARTGPSFDRIIAARRSRRCDLVVVNAPHGEDFNELGDGSVGTNLDMLMARCTAPLLVVREPKAEPAACLETVFVPLTLHEPSVAEAVSWALRVVSGGGGLRLLAVVDREHVEALMETAEDEADVLDLDPSALAGLRRPQMAGLIGTVQKRAAETGLGCRVSVRAGEAVAAAAELANEREQLVVTGCPRRPIDEGFQRVQALARASRNPLLIL